MNTQTFAAGQRVEWLYKPIGRPQRRKEAWVVGQDGDTVTICVQGADGDYFRKVKANAIFSIDGQEQVKA